VYLHSAKLHTFARRIDHSNKSCPISRAVQEYFKSKISRSSSVRGIKVPKQVIVKFDSIHVSMHINTLVDSMGILVPTFKGRHPSIDVLGEIWHSIRIATLRLLDT
jgi:hypothetical protein